MTNRLQIIILMTWLQAHFQPLVKIYQWHIDRLTYASMVGWIRVWYLPENAPR